MKWETGKDKSSFCGATYFSCTMGIDEILAIPLPEHQTPAPVVGHVLYDFVWNKIATTNKTVDREDFKVATFSVYNELEIVFYNYAEYVAGKTLKLSQTT